jgi:hypothetical protein
MKHIINKFDVCNKPYHSTDQSSVWEVNGHLCSQGINLFLLKPMLYGSTDIQLPLVPVLNKIKFHFTLHPTYYNVHFTLHPTFQSVSFLSRFPTTNLCVLLFCPARAVWTAHLTISDTMLAIVCDTTPYSPVNATFMRNLQPPYSWLVYC